MITLQCESCREDFVVVEPCKTRPRRFCSVECSAKSRSTATKIKCLGCDTILNFPKWHKRTFCSRDCANKFHNAKRKVTGVFTCYGCGREAVTIRYLAKTRHYCSQKCYHLHYGRPYTDEQRGKHSRIIKRLWKALAYREKQKSGQLSDKCRSKRSRDRKKYLRTKAGKLQFERMLVASNKHPNKAELKLDGLLQKNFSGEWKLNFPIKVWIDGKAPDFVNVNGRKAVIELFGDYWHGPKITGRTKKQEEQRRIKTFSRWGYETVIIWERELKDLKMVGKKIGRLL